MKLGNIVAFITKWTGIAYVVHKVYPDCGCERRRIKWNNLFTKKKDFTNSPDDIIFE